MTPTDGSRRASIVASLREQRIYASLGVVPAPTLREAYAKTVDLLASAGSPITPAEIEFIGLQAL